MTALIIDTSTDRSLIAISKENEVLAHEVLNHGNQISKFLLPAISKLLGTCNLTAKDLDYIAVGTGPGSYTGTRVGATVAKSLSFALGKPIIGFCSLQAFLPDRNGPFAIVVTTKMQELFILKGTIKDETTQLERPCQIPLQDAATALQNSELIVSLNLESFPTFKCVQAQFNPKGLARCVYNTYLSGANCNDNRLELTYFHNPAKF